MELLETGERIRKFKSALPQYQVTFLTPVVDLHLFVVSLMSDLKIDRGVLTLDLVVFKPDELLDLLDRYSITSTSVSQEYFMHVTITASGHHETAELLEAALGDPVDFVFVLSPGPLSICADHDEYITFFADRKADLEQLESNLIGAGFERKEYLREFAEFRE